MEDFGGAALAQAVFAPLDQLLQMIYLGAGLLLLLLLR